ncbi:type IV pilus secretin PilQ [Pseudorhodoferax sp. Leaf265]|jgi:type IV pilus assembly protein PilQ|uniref:type IV pilus secretin PilQ n=1 Tax=Pseudorhodoferax sp. Leaf265 TaxID=1736315 RepID=UPI0006F9C144|nr:secretin [Pseudorhodoferax sp. Leaf265]PZP97885.1 MAG: type IV pilus secretin PilQ [Variovorax paradoxus]PZQ09179.1 MAG: type IV pilus secretin PilQ [Variovorax paradoxus]
MNKHNHRPGSILARGMAAFGLALACCGAWAVPAIQSVTGAVQNGSEIVRIDLSEAPAALPAGVAIQSPARIALDFAGVVSTMPRTPIDINQGNLRSASVLSVGDRSRVVLNLKQATSYKALLQGNTVLIVLDPVASALPTSPAPVFPDAGAQGRAALRDLDFRRGADNTGRVLVGLGSSQVGVDVRQQGQSLVVEFLNSSLPEGLRRRLDVGDFGTPVQTISTFQVGDRVRMVIEPRGNWEHSAYQSEGQFVVEVRPQRVDPNRLSQGPGFSGEKLSLNFQNIEVRALLQVIADFTNFNVVTSDSVTGAVTLRLKDVPWDQALQIIMDAKGLGMEKSGSVLWIAPKDEIDARKKKDLESAAALENLEPLRTQSFQMNYARATDIAAQITNAGGGGTGSTGNSRFLSSRGTAIPEPRTNQLFVTDVASRLEAVNELIKKLDVAVRQVLIEARIVEASDTFGKSLGVRLGGGNGNGYSIGGGNRIVAGTSYSNATAAANGNAINTSSNFVNLPATAQGAATEAASFAVSIFKEGVGRFLTLELSAMEADGKGKVVSSPRVVTADQTKALIEQGTELPYQVATSSGATSIAFRKANLKLEVTPQITPEGNIILDLDVNKDSVGQSTSAGFAINTKHIKTQVLVENGGTVVIGGIFELTENDDVTKVPLLGDIPIAGNLFKSRTRTSNKTEMLVFITPKMIADRMAGR